jgi:hypothetical protein
VNTNKNKSEAYRKCESILIEDDQSIELTARNQASTPRISIERERGQFFANSVRNQASTPRISIENIKWSIFCKFSAKSGSEKSCSIRETYF